MNNIKNISKKSFLVVLAVYLFSSLALITSDARADKKPNNALPATPDPTLSWFGTYGMQGYPGLLNGYVYAAELNYPFSQVGFYTISGNTFVGQAPALTHINGNCFRGELVGDRFYATLNVDNSYTVPLFDVNTSVGVMDVTMQGQTFLIKIFVKQVVGCNILFESK